MRAVLDHATRPSSSPTPAIYPARRSPDPGDDYLIALSGAQRLPLVSGEKHLLTLAGELRILTPLEFLDLLPDEVDSP